VQASFARAWNPLDLIASNLANFQTSGFKTLREFFYTAAETAEPGACDPTPVPALERNGTDFFPGNLKQTTIRPISPSRPGFFTVTAPSGALYTRNGALQVT